jgi:CBS domain-containing protein
VAARRDDGLARALNQMLERREEAIVVVNAQRHPIGILTEHDGVRLAQAVLSPQVSAAYSASWPVFSVERDQPATIALAVMRRHAVRHIAVTDNGILSGVLSFRDLSVAASGRLLPTRAGELITSPRVIHSVGDKPLVWMARQMSAHRVGCIPIVDAGGRPRAIVTRTDVLHALVSALENEALFPTKVGQMAS